MRRLIFVFGLCLAVLQSCASSKFSDSPFSDLTDAEKKEVVGVNVPTWLIKPFLKQAMKKDEEARAMLPLVKKINKVRMITIQNVEASRANAIVGSLSHQGYEEWMTVKHQTGVIGFHVKQEGDVIRRFFISVRSDRQLVCVDVLGKLRPEDLSLIIREAEKASF
ncbi:DUF4252 domain-containing protein [Bergeyella sp. RCAD1439]|uniref:DUF4252 domain-containing protein n=1 Tax=Bergeyella anatis TaxID=3113737 RepID=UPI002E190FF9|nr:DUF4252 domain-containing protein [Bergeyella sp. RCAD1439]